MRWGRRERRERRKRREEGVYEMGIVYIRMMIINPHQLGYYFNKRYDMQSVIVISEYIKNFSQP